MIKMDFHNTKRFGFRHSTNRVFVIAISCILGFTSINIGHAQEPTTAPLNIKYAFVDQQKESLKENYEFELYFVKYLNWHLINLR